MSQLTITFNVTVQPAGGGTPLTVKDAGGNTLADGQSVQLANETVGQNDPGQVVFVVSGGTAPYNFVVSSGAVPDGMNLSATVNPDGSETVTLAGTPTTAGSDSFGLQISDSGAASATATVKSNVRRVS